MKRYFLAQWLWLALSSIPMMSFAQVSNNNEDGANKIERHAQHAFRQDEVIVKFKADGRVRKMASGKFKSTAVSAVDRVFAELGVEEVEQLMPLTGTLAPNAPRRLKAYNGNDVEIKDLSQLYTIRLDASKQLSVHAAIERLRTLDEVEFAEPNYLVYTTNTGDGDNYKKDPLEKNQWERTAINIYNLWNTPKITSKRPVIAILDTGVDITHPDLADNIWTNTLENEGAEDTDDDANGFRDDIHGWDFVNQTGRIRDNNGHGTHCAGIAAAVGGNGIGLAGANPDAYIMPVTVMQSDGTGDVATIIKGIDYAAANGADVISMSLGGYNHSLAEEQALGHAYATAILVAAAGNDGYCMNHAHPEKGQIAPMPMFPAAYTFVLGVQATQSTGSMTGFSNYDDDGAFFSGYGEEKLYNYELTAPGANIVSTFPGGKYKALNGTSMACPLVAGAISRLMQCKELGSKEELFGDLINSTTAAGNLDIYKAYQMSDENRRPTLNLITYNIDDATGDGDGRPDAGETLDIYPVLRNAWGSAKNIRVSIELAETEDPEIVQIINGTADFGFDLSSYGKATSANPLRIKINDNCIDGRHICLVIKAACDNITEEVKQDVVLKAENGVEIGGVIAEDITLHAGVNYIVNAPLGVPDNVVLTIEPGCVLNFKQNCGISVSGLLVAEGTCENLIVFNLEDNPTVSQAEPYLKFNGYENDKRSLKYCVFNNGERAATEGYASFENCIFKNFQAKWFSHTRYTSLNKCNIINNSYDWYMFEYCLLRNTNIIGNNIRQMSSSIPSWKYMNSCNSYGNYSREAESFINTGDISSTPQVVHNDNPSYLGSSRIDIARQFVYDVMFPNQTSLTYSQIDLSNMLTRPSSEAHGIVWKVVVNGKDAQDEFEELAPLGVGKHKFEVYFNRPMNKAVAPIISMGVREPYTSISIAEEGENSGWNEVGDIYTAYLTINGKTNADGLNRIRVYGAEDDEYFEIPEEKYRFNVMVQKAGSMATGLMATEGLGKVTLNWETAEEDFADLMGYSVYRYENDPESAKQVNETLIEASETEFVDFDVVPGTTYYYMIKEMGTDMQQHDISNVVAATPLTAQKGDANGSMTVDIADVVTEVNYLTGQNPQPFIFEAADVNEDETVNILDVVGTVNIIVSPEAQSMSVSNTATYTVEDGILYVDSDTPLGGVQVNIAAKEGTEFETLAGLKGMEQVASWKNDNECLFLAYSMSGKTIASGKQPLLRIGDAEVSNLIASDAQGHNVLAINGSATSIDEVPFGIEKWEGAEVRYYDLMGRQIARPAKNQIGLFIQSLFLNGECVKSYKIMQ